MLIEALCAECSYAGTPGKRIFIRNGQGEIDIESRDDGQPGRSYGQYLLDKRWRCIIAYDRREIRNYCQYLAENEVFPFDTAVNDRQLACQLIKYAEDRFLLRKIDDTASTVDDILQSLWFSTVCIDVEKALRKLACAKKADVHFFSYLRLVAETMQMYDEFVDAAYEEDIAACCKYATAIIGAIDYEFQRGFLKS